MAQGTDGLTDLTKLSVIGRKIVEQRHLVFERWEKIVRHEIEQAKGVSHPILIDTLPAFMTNLGESISPNYSRDTAITATNVAQEHGGERARLTHYNVENIVREYQILRTVICDVLNEEGTTPTHEEIRIIHTHIDDAIHDAIVGFAIVQTDIKEKFTATLSHDLRNPLSAAQMGAQMILRGPEHSGCTVQAGRIIENLRRMDRMIQDLLDSTIIRSGGRLNLDISETDMLKIVQSCVAEATLLHGDRFKIVGSSCKGFWDGDALTRAFENCIGNAVKYGDSVKPIEFKIHAEHGRIFISIHNEGLPIPLDDQEGIFQIFRRASAARQGSKKGWGVGLALVRGVAESHGGSVILDSSPEHGTTFTIDIPVDARPFFDAPASI